MNSIVAELLAGEKRAIGEADMILDAAGWAASSYANFDRARVDAIARAAAEAGFAAAGALAKATVEETGFGVVADKKIKNELASRGLYACYRTEDFCSKRIVADQKVLELPRPNGVVFALAPSTSPVSTVFHTIMLALMTRNAIVIAPHPEAKGCSVEAARVMANAAEAAGAPASLVQVIDGPSAPLIDHITQSAKVNVILEASAPDNVLVLVDATADIDLAVRRIVDSKSFDNALLHANESVVVTEKAVAEKLLTAFRNAGAYIAKPEEVSQLRALLFGAGPFNIEMLGKSAAEVGRKAGVHVPVNAKVIVAEIDRAGIDEPLSKAKPCPVLGFIRADHAEAAITLSRALLRMSGAGGSAAIYSHDPATILKFAAATKALRVAVNPPSFGLAAIGEGVEPRHLLSWTRIEAREAFDTLHNLDLPAPASSILGREAPISLGVLQEGAERTR